VSDKLERAEIFFFFIADALKAAQNTVEGEVSMGAQYHFYLENQVSIVIVSHLNLVAKVLCFQVVPYTQGCE
jgi:xanthine dehydrogenase molybdopterin-binding subunit B